MINFTQNNFSGGLQRQSSSLKPNGNSYSLLINGRNHNNRISPIKKSVAVDHPEGHPQGLFAVDRWLILFSSGRAFVADTRNKQWIHVNNFSMDNKVDDIHFTVVPGSSLNIERKGTPDTMVFERLVDGSNPAGLAFDGVGQPFVIYPTENGIHSRPTKTYDQWSIAGLDNTSTLTRMDLREYVPAGSKFPLWSGSKLYCVTKDLTGRWTVINQSVSGRPLDFVIRYKADGDKDGDASTTAHSAVSQDITALIPGKAGANYIASSLIESRIVQLDDTFKMFGEPIPRDDFLFNSGPIGHYAYCDIGGDVAFISGGGLINFNAISETKTESRNLNFSYPVKDLLQTKQVTGCATRFDDLALFSVDTIFGPGLLVFDTSTQQFVSLDIIKGLGKIKNLAVSVDGNTKRVWALTVEDQLVELYAGEEYETTRLYLGDYNAQTPARGLSNPKLTAIFSHVSETVELTCRTYIDKQEKLSHRRQISAAKLDDPSIQPIPYANFDEKHMVRLEIPFDGSGFAVGWMLEWTGLAYLEMVDVNAAEGQLTLCNILASAKQITLFPDVYAFIADSGYGNTNAYDRILVDIKQIKPALIVGGGDHIYNNGTEAEYNTAFANFPRIPFKAVAGNHDLDGPAFYQFISPVRFYQYRQGLVEWFFYNGGYNTTGAVLAGANRLPVGPVLEPEGNDINSNQAAWLRAALDASNAKFKIVVMHFPPYCSDAAYYPGYAPLRLPFKRWGATAVLCGHAHNYERLNVDGLPMIICGLGGHSIRGFGPVSPYSIVRYNKTYGYLHITVDSHRMTTALKTIDGEFIDTFSIIA